MSDILEKLYKTVLERRKADPEISYIAKRMKQGTAKIAQKLGEEAVETIIAAMQEDRAGVINESADLLFHWLLLMADADIKVSEVMAELERREGISGLDEKANRKLKGKIP